MGALCSGAPHDDDPRKGLSARNWETGMCHAPCNNLPGLRHCSPVWLTFMQPSAARYSAHVVARATSDTRPSMVSCSSNHRLVSNLSRRNEQVCPVERPGPGITMAGIGVARATSATTASSAPTVWRAMLLHARAHCVIRILLSRTSRMRGDLPLAMPLLGSLVLRRLCHLCYPYSRPGRAPDHHGSVRQSHHCA